MRQVNEYNPQTVIHPGLILEEKLREMKMSIKEFALRSDKPEQTIIAVLQGNSAITQEMAIKFENITKIPSDYWVRHQQRYNEYKTRKKLKTAITDAEVWARHFPYAEMTKSYGLSKTLKIEERTRNLFDYFAIASHIAWEKLYMKSELKVAAYTSLKGMHEPHAISAWLRQGELQAEHIDAPGYDKEGFKKVLHDIKQIMANQSDNFFFQLQQLCLKAGVKVIFTPKLSNAQISGSTRWIKNTPVIQLTARYPQNDTFWFTFFHEAGHILLHGKKYISLENVNFSASDQKKEQEANKFAEKWTFSRKPEQEVIK